LASRVLSVSSRRGRESTARLRTRSWSCNRNWTAWPALTRTTTPPRRRCSARRFCSEECAKCNS